MLLTTTNDLKKYAPVGFDLDFEAIEPSLRKAERRYIIPMIGEQLYERLEQGVENGDLDQDHKKLLHYVCCASVPFGLFFFVQVGGVTIDSSGIYKNKNSTRWNLGTAEQDKLEFAYLSEGYEALDDLLRYLYRNIDKFSLYASSEEYKAESGSLIPSAAVIQEVFSVTYPRVTFKAMLESIRYFETGRIKPVMQDYYHSLIAKAPADFSDDDRELLKLARRALLYLAAGRAMITRTVKLTSEGLQVMSSIIGIVSDAENKRIDAAAKEMTRSGENELSALVRFLNQKAPTGYTPPAAQPARDSCQDKSGIFFP